MKTEFCKKHNLTEGQFDGTEKINGYLDLSSLTSIPEGFNPTVGGYLDLRSGEKYIGAETNTHFISWQNGKYILIDNMQPKKHFSLFQMVTVNMHTVTL